MGLSERRHFLYRRHHHMTVANSAVQCTSMLREKLHQTVLKWIGFIQVDLTCCFHPFDGLIWSGWVSVLLGCVLWS